MPPRTIDWLTAQPFAHRGLHGDNAPENSLAACRGAIEHGYGIEIDVGLSRDGVAIVFHDDDLDRLTDEHGPMEERSSIALTAIRLKGGDEHIPTLSDVLDLVAGRVPLLIEVKAPRSSGTPVGRRCLPVRRALEGYIGPVAVMSFHPGVGQWFRRHAPRTVRGLVITEQSDRTLLAKLRGKLFRRIAIHQADPDFLAVDVRDLPSRVTRRMRAKGVKVLTWTVKTPQDERIAIDHADEMIFERPGHAAPRGLVE